MLFLSIVCCFGGIMNNTNLSAFTILSKIQGGLPTYKNKKNDTSLLMVIGGATAFFVGTDAAYLSTQNWLIDAVGIKDGTPDMIGSCITGSSTTMGFVVAQSTLNTIYPTVKLWTD